MANILWSPEEGTCTDCHRHRNDTRIFTCVNHNTTYCFTCWNLLLEDYAIESQSWVETVNVYWDSPVSMELNEDGDSSGASEWN